jgi:SAM-dependent methyltransferase
MATKAMASSRDLAAGLVAGLVKTTKNHHARGNSNTNWRRTTFTIRRLLARALREFLYVLESLAVRLANGGRTVPRVYKQYPSYDLLKAHQMSRRLREGDAVLDIGCGNGHVLDELGFFRKLERTGIDLAPRQARPGIAMVPYDGWTVPYPDKSFDVTLFCYVLHHLTRAHATRLLEEAFRVTRRTILLMEDSLPTFTPLYRLRNRLHRAGAEIEYTIDSDSFRVVGDESMFLTYGEWTDFLKAFSSSRSVTVEPLGAICKYQHHALIAVECRGPACT